MPIQRAGYAASTSGSSAIVTRSRNAATRAAHLHELFADPGVAGIVCVRGGYGSVQTLPLLDLARIGVDALKIEGRMKSPEYVATTVALYRALIDGGADAEVTLTAAKGRASAPARTRARARRGARGR